MSTIARSKPPAYVSFAEKREDRMPVEAGGVPIAEMGDTIAAAKPAAFELHNEPSDPRLNSNIGIGGIEGGRPDSLTSASAAVVRKPVSPTPNRVTTNSSAFPPPWEGDGLTMAYHISQMPPDGPSQQTSPPQNPQISQPSAQNTVQQHPAEMGAAGGGDAELLRLEREIAKVREKKERLRHLSELEAKEEELLRSIEERRKIGGSNVLT